MKSDGISMLEVLISLVLITTICVGLLRSQWYLSKRTNHFLLQWRACQHLSNACARVKTGLPLQTLPEPFQWLQSAPLTIQWCFANHCRRQQLDCSS